LKLRLFKTGALMTMVLLGATAAYVVAGPVAAAPGGGGTCIVGATKIDNPGDFEVITAPAGQVITQVAVKAGSAQSGGGCFLFTADGIDPSGCYAVSGLGTSSVTVERVGTGSACKGISHIEYVLGPGTTPTTPTTPTTTTSPTTSTITTTTTA
jgi:hypothetical protein